MNSRNAFRHLDESARTTYRGTVLFGLEIADDRCLLIKVKADYVCETPDQKEWKWIRGMSLDTLKPFFKLIKPLRIISDAY